MEAGDVTPDSWSVRCAPSTRCTNRFYGYSITGEVIELIRFNVTVSGQAAGRCRCRQCRAMAHGPPDSPAAAGTVYFQGHGLTDTPIYRREELPAGFSAEGPLIVEEVSSTTVVHPGQTLEVTPPAL